MFHHLLSRLHLRHIVAALGLIAVSWMAPAQAAKYEVWLVDQSNSPGKTYGGAIHIYEGSDLHGEALTSATPISVIDLGAGAAALCLGNTGANPVRPHMVLFNSTHSHAILSFVVSGHVLILDAATRAPLACFQTAAGAGGARQAHASFPAPDDSYILVANQNGKQLERILTDYTTNTFTYDAAATRSLTGACITPNGVACELAGVRPDNAPICPIIDSTSQLGFVTLRGGGLFVVDATTSPISILAEYDMATVHGNGCGGAEAGGSMYVNSGGGTPANLSEFDVYRFPLTGYSAANPPNTPAPALLYSDDATPDRDSHGMVLSKHGRYVWVADRDLDVIEVFDTATGSRVNTINLQGITTDLSLDLGDISPSGNRVFFSTRGPNPLSGDPHASIGDLPGVAVIQVEQGGRHGRFKGVARISNVDAGGIERADGHGLRVRRK
jgi:hypothetical protein